MFGFTNKKPLAISGYINGIIGNDFVWDKGCVQKLPGIFCGICRVTATDIPSY